MGITGRIWAQAGIAGLLPLVIGHQWQALVTSGGPLVIFFSPLLKAPSSGEQLFLHATAINFSFSKIQVPLLQDAANTTHESETL